MKNNNNTTIIWMVQHHLIYQVKHTLEVRSITLNVEYKPKQDLNKQTKKLKEIDEIEENEISAGKWALKSENRKKSHTDLLVAKWNG